MNRSYGLSNNGGELLMFNDSDKVSGEKRHSLSYIFVMYRSGLSQYLSVFFGATCKNNLDI